VIGRPAETSTGSEKKQVQKARVVKIKKGNPVHISAQVWQDLAFIVRGVEVRQNDESRAASAAHIRYIPVLCLGCLGFLLLFDLEEQRAVDMRQDTSESDGRSDEGVEFLVTTDGKLKMPGCNTLDLEVLGCVLSNKCQPIVGAR